MIHIFRPIHFIIVSVNLALKFVLRGRLLEIFALIILDSHPFCAGNTFVLDSSPTTFVSNSDNLDKCVNGKNRIP